MTASVTATLSQDAAPSKKPDCCPQDKPRVPIDYDPEHRVEPIPKPGFPHHLYPRWIGQKFTPDGTVLPYPGNTVVCHLPQDSPLQPKLLALHNDIRKQDFSPLFVLLPPSSWHMTVYEGVTDQIRTRNCWPAELPLDAELRSCHAHVTSKLAGFKTGLDLPITMKIAGFEKLDDGIALKLEASDKATDCSLRVLRDRLSETLKMRHPGHKSYSFHLSIGYALRHLTDHDRARIWQYLEAWRRQLPDEFTLGSPEYCVYDDMFAFRRVFSLEE